MKFNLMIVFGALALGLLSVGPLVWASHSPGHGGGGVIPTIGGTGNTGNTGNNDGGHDDGPATPQGPPIVAAQDIDFGEGSTNDVGGSAGCLVGALR